MMLKLALLIFASVAVISAQKYGASDIKTCGSEDSMKLHNVQLKNNDDGNVQLKMKVELFTDIGSENYFKIAVEKVLPNGKLKPIINVRQKDGCKALQTYGGDVYRKGAAQAKVPHPETCPVEKGKYELDWYTIDLSAIPIIKMVPNGKFKVTIQMFTMTNKEFLCVSLVAEKN